MPTPTQQTTEVAVMQATAVDLVDQLPKEIETHDGYAVAGELRVSLKNVRNKIVDHHKPMKQAADVAKKVILDAEKALLLTVDPAIDKLKVMLSTYIDKQDREAEVERLKMTQDLRSDQEEFFQTSAEVLEKKGDKVGASALIEQGTQPVQGSVAKKELPKVKGLVKRKGLWTYDIVDESAIPREYFTLDRKKLAGVVKAMKADTNIAGIRARQEGSSV